MMDASENLHIELKPYVESEFGSVYDLDKIIYDLNNQIDLLSSQADKFDYLVSIGSGVICGLLDILWVGEFSLERGRNIASDKIDGFVKKTAKLLGCKDDDLGSPLNSSKRSFRYRATAIHRILAADCNIIYAPLTGAKTRMKQSGMKA